MKVRQTFIDSKFHDTKAPYTFIGGATKVVTKVRGAIDPPLHPRCEYQTLIVSTFQHFHVLSIWTATHSACKFIWRGSLSPPLRTKSAKIDYLRDARFMPQGINRASYAVLTPALLNRVNTYSPPVLSEIHLVRSQPNNRVVNYTRIGAGKLLTNSTTRCQCCRTTMTDLRRSFPESMGGTTIPAIRIKTNRRCCDVEKTS